MFVYASTRYSCAKSTILEAQCKLITKQLLPTKVSNWQERHNDHNNYHNSLCAIIIHIHKIIVHFRKLKQFVLFQSLHEGIQKLS